VTRASQTFKSGKLNEVIDLFVGEVDVPPCRRNQGRIEAEATSANRRFGLLDDTLDAREDQLARGTSPPRRDLTQTPVQIPRKIDARANGIRLHSNIVGSST